MSDPSSESLVVGVQARMSSHRFPGKVLAPFQGRPLITHVLDAIERALPGVRVVVVTSVEPSDDPLAAFLLHRGVPVLRGPLDHVFERYRLCVAHYPCEWILRISADSPLLDSAMLRAVAFHEERSTSDVVTTIFPRTFPKGQNAELIRSATLLGLSPDELSSDDQEHVTPVFYRSPDRFRITNVESGDTRLAAFSTAVDTVEDLQHLERVAAGSNGLRFDRLLATRG